MAKMASRKRHGKPRRLVRGPDINSIEFHVLIFKEGDWWVAQCLQYDIAAQARTIEDLDYQFEYAVNAHIATSLENGLVPFVDLSPAPQKYWDTWRRAWRLEKPPSIRFRAPRHFPEHLIPEEKEYRFGDLIPSPA